MSQRFDLRELIRLAVVDERSGAELYERLAGQVRAPGLADRFRAIAEQERRHERRFTRMLDELGDAPPEHSYPDEYVAYLEALVAEGRWRESPVSRQTRDDAEAIAVAVAIERNQLGLLNEIAETLAEKDHRLVKDIIAEERRHLVDLAAARRELPPA